MKRLVKNFAFGGLVMCGIVSFALSSCAGGSDSQRSNVDSVTLDETPVPANLQDNDWSRMKLKGQVKNMEEIFGGVDMCMDGYLCKYKFDVNGMLTEVATYQEGMAYIDRYNNGKIVSSTEEEDVENPSGESLSFYYEYEKKDANNELVYKVNAKTSKKEKCKHLIYDNNGKLLKEMQYIDGEFTLAYDYESDESDVRSDETIVARDGNGNWTEVHGSFDGMKYAKTRKITYY